MLSMSCSPVSDKLGALSHKFERSHALCKFLAAKQELRRGAFFRPLYSKVPCQFDEGWKRGSEGETINRVKDNIVSKCVMRASRNDILGLRIEAVMSMR